MPDSCYATIRGHFCCSDRPQWLLVAPPPVTAPPRPWGSAPCAGRSAWPCCHLGPRVVQTPRRPACSPCGPVGPRPSMPTPWDTPGGLGPPPCAAHPVPRPAPSEGCRAPLPARLPLAQTQAGFSSCLLFSSAVLYSVCLRVQLPRFCPVRSMWDLESPPRLLECFPPPDMSVWPPGKAQ